MKHIFRFIGVVVVVVILAALVLYYLNGQGYIRGPLSEWISNMSSHVNGAITDTQDTIDEFRGKTPDPTEAPQPTQDISGLENLSVTEPPITPEPLPDA